jgi:hypothetical protein
LYLLATYFCKFLGNREQDLLGPKAEELHLLPFARKRLWWQTSWSLDRFPLDGWMYACMYLIGFEGKLSLLQDLES